MYKKYDEDLKESIIAQMLPPNNVPASELAEKAGIPYTTLIEWRRLARRSEDEEIGDNQVSRNWSSEEKFNIVVQTAGMNAEEINGFCRSTGIYPEQLEMWRDTCKTANATQSTVTRELRHELREERNKVHTLERDLRRKEKALAETAALLVLRKKADAIWGAHEEE